MPKFSNMSLAVSSTPALEVGGDYYDLVDLDDGNSGNYVLNCTKS